MVQLVQNAADFGQSLRGGVQAARVQIFAERIADDADGLHRVTLCLAGGGERVALGFGFGENAVPLRRVARQDGEGGDGADAAEFGGLQVGCHEYLLVVCDEKKGGCRLLLAGAEVKKQPASINRILYSSSRAFTISRWLA